MDGTCIRSAPNKLLVSCEQAVTCHSDQQWKTHHYDDKCAAMRFMGSNLEHLGYHVPQTTIDRAQSCMFEIDPDPAHGHPNRPIVSELGNLLVKSNEDDVHCEGRWGSWGKCSPDGEQIRHYAVTTAKQGWGRACLYENGEKQKEDCTHEADVACEGEWGTWGACMDGTQTRTYTIKTPRGGSGAECDAGDGEVQIKNCTQREAKSGEPREAISGEQSEAISEDKPVSLISREDLYDALRHVEADPLFHSVGYIMMM